MCGDDHVEHPDDETAREPLPDPSCRQRNDATTSSKPPRRFRGSRSGWKVIRLALGDARTHHGLGPVVDDRAGASRSSSMGSARCRAAFGVDPQGPATITWTGTFYPYGVEVFHESITDHLVLGEGGPQRIGPDASHPGVWAPYLGSSIHCGVFHWERLEIGPAERADGTVVGPRTRWTCRSPFARTF
jgi:hypothetical protein